MLEKIDKKPTRLSNSEYLGLDMIEAGNGFGPETSYGNKSHICSINFMTILCGSIRVPHHFYCIQFNCAF